MAVSPSVSANKKAPVFPAIPVPSTEPESLHKTCLALKQAVEMLTGGDALSRSGDTADRFASHVFVQKEVPVALHTGDLWLSLGDSWTFNLWDGNNWVLLLTVPVPAVVSGRAYRMHPDVARVRR